MSENILCVKNIKKSFGGVHALKGVDLTIKKGETHCLAGENGCGKSTIIKVISGFYKPDEGTIEIDGKGYTNMSTADAIAAGIQVIYQDFSIFPNLTVMENLAFNQVLAEKKKFVNKKEFRKIAEEAVRKINFDVDLDARVETLPVADKQLIAISRALLHNAKLIIMDEPTTALTKREVTRLFGIIEELKKEGITILFVSHKLDEVFEISDSITILRSGQNVYHCPASEMTEEKFTYYMTGRNIDTSEKKEVKDFSETEKVLEVKDLSAKGFEHINFDLHAGEILGIAGQLGSGRTELSLALFGMLKPTGGSICISGKEVKLKNVAEAQKQGIALVPEDRLTEGLFLPQPIYKNIAVTSLKELSGALGSVKESAQKELSEHWVKEIGVATKDHTLPVQTLSGGNQQKVIISRWLANDPDVLIMDEPTAGLDVEARNEILDMLRAYIAEDESRSILITSHISTDLESLCDELYLIHDGKLILHEATDAILEQYGILKVSEEQYRTLDQSSILKVQKENYGYVCLTNENAFYIENYPQIIIEKAAIDEIVTMLSGGDEQC